MARATAAPPDLSTRTPPGFAPSRPAGVATPIHARRPAPIERPSVADPLRCTRLARRPRSRPAGARGVPRTPTGAHGRTASTGYRPVARRQSATSGNNGSADARNPGSPFAATSSSPRSRAGFTAPTVIRGRSGSRRFRFAAFGRRAYMSASADRPSAFTAVYASVSNAPHRPR